MKENLAAGQSKIMTSTGAFLGSSPHLPRCRRNLMPPGGPPSSGGTQTHSAGRQAPRLEMEPVAPNDFRGVFRGGL